MKLKFTAAACDVVNIVSAMPDEAANEKDLDKPFEAIRDLDKKLATMTGIGTKQWTKIRRELSFFFSLQHAIEKRTEDKTQRYTEAVKCFKSIKSEDSLKIISFVRLAMSYGLVNLSDFEIEHLIKLNKA